MFEVLKTQTDSTGNPYITPEALSRWNSIAPDKQAGILSAAGAKMQEDKKQQALDRQNRLADSQSNYLEAKAHNEWSGGNQSGSEPVITDPLKVGDQVVPGFGVNRKTGAYIDFRNSSLERDAATGVLGVRTKGQFKPLTASQLQAMSDDPNNPTVRQTAPPPKDKNAVEWLSDGMDHWFGGDSQTTAKELTTPQLDGITGQTPLPGTTPAAPAPKTASGPSPQDQQALQWAYANPQDPRAAAILKKLGIQ